MKIKILALLLMAVAVADAQLPFKLPPKAKYTASKKSITEATEVLKRHLIGNADTLTNLFVKPTMCGPGLWHILKNSPHFAKPPAAESSVKIPLPGGKYQELPTALLQSDEEVASFRKAFADALGSQGTLEIRDPNREEFMVFWTTIPFDKMDQPLLVAAGKDSTFICLFEKKGRVFWVDEVKKMHFQK